MECRIVCAYDNIWYGKNVPPFKTVILSWDHHLDVIGGGT